MIEKRGRRWALISKTGKVLGLHATREGAVAQEEAIKSREGRVKDIQEWAKNFNRPRLPEGLVRKE